MATLWLFCSRDILSLLTPLPNRRDQHGYFNHTVAPLEPSLIIDYPKVYYTYLAIEQLKSFEYSSTPLWNTGNLRMTRLQCPQVLQNSSVRCHHFREVYADFISIMSIEISGIIMQLSIVCPTTPMTGMGGGRVGIRQLGKCNCPTPWAVIVIESNPPINLPPSSKYQLSNCSDHHSCCRGQGLPPSFSHRTNRNPGSSL